MDRWEGTALRRYGRAGLGGAAAALALLLVAPRLAAQEARLEPEARTLTIVDAVRAALERNPQIRTARYALEEASGRVTEAWGSVLPHFDFSADYTRNVSPAVNFLPAFIFDPNAGPDEQVAVQFGADNLWTSVVTVEQPIFDGRAFVGVGAAGRYEALQEEILRGETHAVVTRVRTAFYDALLAEEQLRLTDNSVRRVRETLEETRSLNRAGLASEYDVLRLDVELANLEPNLLRAKNALRQARRQLAVELDVDPGDSLGVEGSLATMDLDDVAANAAANRQILAFAGMAVATDESSTDAVVEMARGNRSDLRQLGLTEDLRNAELRAEQAQYLPKVSLFGNYGISASQNGGPDFFGEPRAYSRRVGLQVTVPIFDGFGREARVDQRRSALRAARSRTRYAQDQAESQVRTLLDQAEEARLRASAQRMTVGQAERGFDIARAQFREGLGSQLELTDAEVALRQSEFNYAQSVYDYLVARARLDEATGRVPFAEPGVGEELLDPTGTPGGAGGAR